MRKGEFKVHMSFLWKSDSCNWERSGFNNTISIVAKNIAEKKIIEHLFVDVKD